MKNNITFFSSFSKVFVDLFYMFLQTFDCFITEEVILTKILCQGERQRAQENLLQSSLNGKSKGFKQLMPEKIVKVENRQKSTVTIFRKRRRLCFICLH